MSTVPLASSSAPSPVPGPDSPTTPRVLLHIGEPKTGTTFLQQVLWGNRAALARQGVHVPGDLITDQWRATQDLRRVEQPPGDPAGSFAGDWDRIAAEARSARGTGVISHELLAAVEPADARRALASLAPAEVHVAITVRGIAGLLPAEYQESVKHRTARSWPEWLADVVDVEARDPDRRRWWFWKVHDTAEILRVWAAELPPERVHVVTVPPPGSPPNLLWQRFAGLLGVDPHSIDLSVAEQNASLGVVEVELLRRLNAALPADYPNWAYMDWVKLIVAQRLLVQRPDSGRLQLPAERLSWAREHAEQTIAALAERRYHVIGDLDELRPPAPREVDAERAAAQPAAVPDEAVLDAALTALSGLLVEIEDERREATLSPPPLLKDVVAHLSARHPRVHELRVRYWHAMEAVRRARRRAGRSVT